LDGNTTKGTKLKVQILAMDTSTVGCSAALWRDGGIISCDWAAMARGQSEALVPMVKDVMSDAQAAFSDLDALAVTIGPGAFTGLRIGLAAARGMALSLGVPCLSVTTLEAIAHSVDPSVRSGNTILTVLDSKRADIYAQAFGPDLSPLNQASAIAAEQVFGLIPEGPVVIVGDIAERIAVKLNKSGTKTTVAPGLGIPDAAIVAEIAAARWSPEHELPSPEPLYLRPPDAKIPKDGGRLRV
jgi:tRNA threonylcarbamoyladenosine biosynthesis protein TsaB